LGMGQAEVSYCGAMRALAQLHSRAAVIRFLLFCDLLL
jgi:hypothetical protein